MIHAILIVLCGFATVSLSLPDSRAISNVSDKCENFCFLDERNPLMLSWVWLNEEDGRQFQVFETTTLSMTIVTIVNTVLGKTSTRTELPPQYTPPPTNSLGTHVQTISFYLQSGQHSTTVLTYPSVFIAWPDDYIWTGTLSTGGDSSCVTAPSDGVTVHIKSRPQPTECSPFCSQISKDPKGLFHNLAIDEGRWQWSGYSTLMADQPAITSCFDGDAGPNWGGFTQTNWYTLHKLIETGDNGSHPTPTTPTPSRKSATHAVMTSTHG